MKTDYYIWILKIIYEAKSPEGVIPIHEIRKEFKKMLKKTVLTPINEKRISGLVIEACKKLEECGFITKYESLSYYITQKGKDFLISNPDRETLEKEFVSPIVVVKNENASVQAASIVNYFKKEEARIYRELMDQVMSISPYEFEKLIIKLLNAMGYGNEGASIHTKLSGDEGIDGIICHDPLGFDKVYIQAKQWAEDNYVGRPDIQAFSGAISNNSASRGLFVTTSGFTKEAVEYSKKVSTARIVLMDGSTLIRTMLKYGLGVKKTAEYAVYEIDNSLFEH